MRPDSPIEPIRDVALEMNAKITVFFIGLLLFGKLLKTLNIL